MWNDFHMRHNLSETYLLGLDAPLLCSQKVWCSPAPFCTMHLFMQRFPPGISAYSPTHAGLTSVMIVCPVMNCGCYLLHSLVVINMSPPPQNTCSLPCGPTNGDGRFLKAMEPVWTHMKLGAAWWYQSNLLLIQLWQLSAL